jgi:uncharacterized membrane protein
LAAAVEVIEMVIIVVGVGSVRGWRSTWLGVGAGLAVLAVLMVAFGTALGAVPIGALRLVVGSLLLVFGLQWLRKGIRRMSTNGLAGMGERTASAESCAQASTPEAEAQFWAQLQFARTTVSSSGGRGTRPPATAALRRLPRRPGG